MVNVPRLHGRTPLQNYLCLKVFHSDSSYGNSVFNTTYNFNGGYGFGNSFGSGFWNGIGMGLGAGLMNLFGFGGNCCSGGWGGCMPMFGGGWGGGFPSFGNWWGGSNGSTGGGNQGNTSVTGGNTSIGGNTYNTINKPAKEDLDAEDIKNWQSEYSELKTAGKDADPNKVKKLYNEVKARKEGLLDRVHTHSNKKALKAMIKGLEQLAKDNNINLEDIKAPEIQAQERTDEKDDALKNEKAQGVNTPDADTDPFAGKTITQLVIALDNNSFDDLDQANQEKFKSAFLAALDNMKETDPIENIRTNIQELEDVKNQYDTNRLCKLEQPFNDKLEALKAKLNDPEQTQSVLTEDTDKKDYSKMSLDDELKEEDYEKITPSEAENILGTRIVTDDSGNKFIKVPRNYKELMLANIAISGNNNNLKISFCQNTKFIDKEGKSDTIQGKIKNNTITNNGNENYTITVNDKYGEYVLTLDFNSTDAYTYGYIELNSATNAKVDYKGESKDLTKVNSGTKYAINEDAQYATRDSDKPAVGV